MNNVGRPRLYKQRHLVTAQVEKETYDNFRKWGGNLSYLLNSVLFVIMRDFARSPKTDLEDFVGDFIESITDNELR